MTRESIDWLNTNVLVGFTDRRGNAWHWRKGTDNHYADAIPVEEVRKRLFDWEPEKVDMFYEYDGKWRGYPGKSIIIRSDTGAPLGAASDGFNPHPYSGWLRR